MKEIAPLHFITQPVQGLSYPELVDQVCTAGVRWVQLRLKGVSFLDWLGIARSVKWVCQRHGAALIINDNPYVAKEVRADGVHLGQKDMDPVEARKLLGAQSIIGGTANTLEQALALSMKQVDYIGLGPLRFTSTKEELSPVLGVEGVQQVIEGLRAGQVNTPVVVIGGIESADLPLLKRHGAHGVAVSSAITSKLDNLSVTIGEFLSV
jgi:thiamine-phosphate pyrophosphorylase